MMKSSTLACSIFVLVTLSSQFASAARLTRVTPVNRAAKLLPSGFASAGTKSMYEVIAKVEAEISIAQDLRLSPSERKALNAYKAATDKFREAASADGLYRNEPTERRTEP